MKQNEAYGCPGDVAGSRMKRLLQRVYWRVLRLAGLGRLSWNAQFKAGVWCREGRSPHTLSMAAKLCGGGRMIEFGCGEGNLPLLLPPGSFSDYTGFDISDVAVQTARKLTREKGLANCRFEAGDMAEWTGADPVRLIVAEECVYYLPPPVLERFLKNCCASLDPKGAILVIVHSATKHAESLAVCRSACRVVEEKQIEERAYLTLATKNGSKPD